MDVNRIVEIIAFYFFFFFLSLLSKDNYTPHQTCDKFCQFFKAQKLDRQQLCVKIGFKSFAFTSTNTIFRLEMAKQTAKKSVE